MKVKKRTSTSKQKTPKIKAAAKRLHEINRILAPFQKKSVVTEFSTEGKWVKCDSPMALDVETAGAGVEPAPGIVLW